MEPSDTGHRPHAIHTGETPTFPITVGPSALKVSLDLWGPKDNLFAVMWNELQANWGERPERVTQDEELTAEQWKYVEKCFAGKTLPQVLEGIHFWFTIDGVSRACTHQLVRSRIGAAFMQHGGRDNDWRHRGFTIPETVSRAMNYLADAQGSPELQHCLVDTKPIADFLRRHGGGGLHDAIGKYLAVGHELYAALVDAGIPWQDARRFLHIGTQTYIHANYTYAALSNFLANRLEHVMDWEINCVAQLMLREVKLQCPPLLSRYLRSHSDRFGKAAFAGLESWPPDQKYPTPYEPAERTHRAVQMPFWVLSKESMEGAPVSWIATNGVYPTQT